MLSDIHENILAAEKKYRPISASGKRPSSSNRNRGISKPVNGYENGEKIQENYSSFHLTREDLIIELQEVKLKNLSCETIINTLRVENSKLEKEVIKQQQRLDKLLGFQNPTSALANDWRRDLEKSQLIRQYKKQIQELRDNLSTKETELENEKKSQKASNLLILAYERDEYFCEVQRLQNVVQELKNELVQERQRRELQSSHKHKMIEDSLRQEISNLTVKYNNILASLMANDIGVAKKSKSSNDVNKKREKVKTDAFLTHIPVGSANTNTSKSRPSSAGSRRKKSNRATAMAIALSNTDYAKIEEASDKDELPAQEKSSKLKRRISSAINGSNNDGSAINSKVQNSGIDATISSTTADINLAKQTVSDSSKTAEIVTTINTFEIGDRVEAGYSGSLGVWHVGCIKSINDDGTYHIEYYDGEEEFSVSATYMRLADNTTSVPPFISSIPPVNKVDIIVDKLKQEIKSNDMSIAANVGKSFKFNVNDKIMAQYYNGNTFYPGVITAVYPSPDSNNSNTLLGVYDVLYDDGDRENKVNEKNIKRTESKENNSVVKSAEETSNEDVHDSAYDDGDLDNSVKETNIKYPDSAVLAAVDAVDEYKSFKFKVGDKVLGKFRNGVKYFPATIRSVSVSSDDIDVGVYDLLYDDGDLETNVLETNIQPINPVTSTISTISKFKVNDKVLGKYNNGLEYIPACVVAVVTTDTDEYLYNLQYDSGESETNVIEQNVKLNDTAAAAPAAFVSIAPTGSFKYNVNDNVTVRYKNGPKYYSATIMSVNKLNGENLYDVIYDDGDRETNVLELNIKAIDPSTVAEVAGIVTLFKVDDKVLVKYRNGLQYYPATIKSVHNLINEFVYDVLYDDGDNESNVKTENIKLLDPSSIPTDSVQSALAVSYKFKVDDKVSVKYKNGQTYYPATIKSVQYVNNESVYDVLYDDGDRESNVIEQNIKFENTPTTIEATAEAITKLPTVSCRFNINDKVSAKYKNGSKYFLATIKSVNIVNGDYLYDVLYDDGDRETNVIEQNIKFTDLPETAVTSSQPRTDTSLSSSVVKVSNTFSIQDKVLAKFKNSPQFYAATVTAVYNNDSSEEPVYDLLFDDGDSERGVCKSNIKYRPVAVVDSQSYKFKVNDKVLSLFSNGLEYFPGTITAVYPASETEGEVVGLYDILYDDGDYEYLVPEMNIKALVSKDINLNEVSSNILAESEVSAIINKDAVNSTDATTIVDDNLKVNDNAPVKPPELPNLPDNYYKELVDTEEVYFDESDVLNSSNVLKDLEQDIQVNEYNVQELLNMDSDVLADIEMPVGDVRVRVEPQVESSPPAINSTTSTAIKTAPVDALAGYLDELSDDEVDLSKNDKTAKSIENIDSNAIANIVTDMSEVAINENVKVSLSTDVKVDNQSKEVEYNEEFED